MYVRNALVAGMQKLTVRCFLKGPGPSLMIAGTLALAGFGAAALNGPTGTSAQHDRGSVTPSNQPSTYGCYNDPDGDGTIKCDVSIPISGLPASWGACYANLHGDGLTVCDGPAR